MDGAVLTAILIIAVVVVAEGISLFSEFIFKDNSYYAIIPVLTGDDSLRENILNTLEQTDAKVILLDCGAGEIYKDFCESFCINHENVVFLAPCELKDYFLKEFVK